MMITTRLC